MSDGDKKLESETSFSEPQVDECANCGLSLQGTYCTQCGQRNEPLRQPIGHFLKEAFTELFGVDGRLWQSFRLLLFKPGRLTTAYLTGHRVRFIRPLRIYLTASILFFFLLSLIDPAGQVDFGFDEVDVDSTVTVAQYREILDAKRVSNAELIVRQEKLVDSLNVQYVEDSLAFATQSLIAINDSTAGDSLDVDLLDEQEEDLEDLLDDRDDERGDLISLRNRVAERSRQLNWLESQIATAPADSMVHPADMELAVQLLFDEAPGQNMNFDLPEWWPKGESVKRAQQARTNQEVQAAMVSFLTDAFRRLPTVMFTVLPIFALLLKGLYLRREWYYSEHLVFGLHTHGFAFIIFSMMLLVSWIGLEFSEIPFIRLSLLLTIPVYFYIAQKHVYGQGWFKTALKAWVLGWVYTFVLICGMLLALVLAVSL